MPKTSLFSSSFKGNYYVTCNGYVCMWQRYSVGGKLVGVVVSVTLQEGLYIFSLL